MPSFIKKGVKPSKPRKELIALDKGQDWTCNTCQDIWKELNTTGYVHSLASSINKRAYCAIV
ncbi:MAG: hypothetical protein ISS54_02140 [Dehalococcoidia bacterium]|nr:hypothetical protein [Dehalococcoidia bacterium]